MTTKKGLTPFEEQCVNTIRMLAVDAVQKANSGHPGAPMGLAPAGFVLWTEFLKVNPRDPLWADRDRFVLSAGHASMLLYSLLHLTGFDLSLDDIRQFRQMGSRTPGHPERGVTPGVEVTTGQLGQGFANGVGMAMAERFLAATFNRPGFEIVDHTTYAIVSDGDLMEGVTSEAASLAGRLKLGKLVYLYDDNHITIEGGTNLAFDEDVAKRFEAYGWQVLRVSDADHDLPGIRQAIREARGQTQKPSLIMLRTHIGYGSPNKQNSEEAHGAPLGAEEAALTRKNLGWTAGEFRVPAEVEAFCRRAVERGSAAQTRWQELFAGYEARFPREAARWREVMAQGLPAGWDASLPVYPAEKGAVATRNASGEVLNRVAGVVDNLLGGSADLGPSTKTLLKGLASFGPDTPGGRNLHFGIREHAMGAVSVGLAAHGGVIPYCGTFFMFADYMRPPIRIAALMKTRVIFVFSHDSIGVGEDGPTHQPVEHLAALRAMPGVVVIRPADANETAQAWRVALERADGPTVLVLTRQNVPVLPETAGLAASEGLARGAYVVREARGGAARLLLLATGSEVALALQARELLERRGVPTRVVSFPSWELFERQPVAYRDSVLPPALTARLSVEAGIAMGWRRWVGDRGDSVSLDRFGESAPAPELFKKFGFTPEQVEARALALLEGGAEGKAR